MINVWYYGNRILTNVWQAFHVTLHPCDIVEVVIIETCVTQRPWYVLNCSLRAAYSPRCFLYSPPKTSIFYWKDLFTIDVKINYFFCAYWRLLQKWLRYLQRKVNENSFSFVVCLMINQPISQLTSFSKRSLMLVPKNQG